MYCVECPHIMHPNNSGLFLAGGITGCPDWQSEIVQMLVDTPYTLVNPRRKKFPIDDPGESKYQITWEHHHLHVCRAILFWFPKESICPIALYELGYWVRSDKPLFIGMHPDYSRRVDIETQIGLARPAESTSFFYTLEDLVKSVKQFAFS